jgi:hypothetical protein
MSAESYYPLGQIGGAEVGVQPSLDGQDILIQHGDIGRRLVCLLACGNTEIVRRGETLYWRVHHSPEVDRLLTDLTDLFISIRYAHPTLVQLELELDACARTAGASEPAP